MKKFYLHNGQNQDGPFNIDELKALNIEKDTPIWYEGIENWTTAEKVEELKSILPVNVVPPKFEKPNQINTTSLPPKFNKTENLDNSQNFQSISNIQNKEKKSNLNRNILIGVGSIIGVILIGVIAIKFQNNNNDNYNYSGETAVTVDSLGNPQNTNYDNSAEIERQNINSAITQKNMAYRNSWYEYITTQLGEYSYREIGGIDPFIVQVTNNTEYKMDNIDVDVEYVKANGEVYDTETLVFKNVSANSSLQLYTSGSERGTSARAQISNIGSSKMHFCYPSDNGNPNDPFFCK